MFDFLFNSMAAYTQVMMVIGGLMCAGIGGLLTGNGWYWKLRATRVEGTILGVREKDRCYFNVYRYTLPDGRAIEATSDSGSGMTGGRETGRTVTLLVFPENPENMREDGVMTITLVGLFFVIPGLALLYFAFTSYPVTWFTWAALAAVAGIGAIKFQKYIIPKDQRLSPAAWMEDRRRARAEEWKSRPARPIEELLDTPEKQVEMQKQRKINRVAAPLLVLAGIGMMAGGWYTGQNVKTLNEHGLRARGEVVRLDASRGSDSTTYHAVVDFMDESGKKLEFRDSVGSNPPSFHGGEEVTVLYLADSPAKSAVIDRGIWNWLPPGLLALFGALLCFIGVKIMPRRDATV